MKTTVPLGSHTPFTGSLDFEQTQNLRDFDSNDMISAFPSASLTRNRSELVEPRLPPFFNLTCKHVTRSNLRSGSSFQRAGKSDN